MEGNVRYIHFTFLDNSKMKLVWPKQGSKDPQIFANQVKNSLEAGQFMAQVEGQLLVIPMRNVKYMIVSPAPEALPQGIIRNAKIAT